jgi:putative OPT family oligopeptide transporter
MHTTPNAPPSNGPAPHQPFVPPHESPPELTPAPVVLGALLGIVFGASSVYLVLKVGLTVSASIPVAVLAFALFRGLSAVTGLRKASILENNIVQTTGSAGESIAFGVGLVMPALLLLGFEIEVVRVMTVGVLGGLLGILMMIPLRRAFIVKKHGELKYPEGTACADVLIAGEKGGATARMVFFGFGLGFVYQFLMGGLKLWKSETHFSLAAAEKGGIGLKGGAIGSEMSPALVGVGYIIGPRIASIMVAGGVLAYLVITPTIVYFGENLDNPLPPAVSSVDPETKVDKGLIRNMSEGALRNNYILYIGAGAVAAGGIISMIQALPVIFGSVFSAVRDLRSAGNGANGNGPAAVPRTERDLPYSVVVFGSLGLVLAIAAAPQLGLGLNPVGILGAVMILLFGFLFVTVSSRLTGEIGSSSNPISGMTVATLLLTCLVLVALSEAGAVTISKETKLLALTIAGVVCIASSNGGTTSQTLKTGYLVGATPRNQQFAILIGALTSALVVGLVLLAMNQAGTVYSKKNLPAATADVTRLTEKDRVRTGPYAAEDRNEYHVLNIGQSEKPDPTLFKSGNPAVPPGRYLIAADGSFAYLCDPAVNGKLEAQDNGDKVANKFQAPKTQLFALIIDGIFDRNLPWELVLIGVLVAITLELSGVPSLPFAVGVYLPLAASVPIFVGGMVRLAADKLRPAGSGGDGDSSPGVLLSSGYIAGASIMAVALALMQFSDELPKLIDFSGKIPTFWIDSNQPALAALGLLVIILLLVGSERFGRNRGE